MLGSLSSTRLDMVGSCQVESAKVRPWNVRLWTWFVAVPETDSSCWVPGAVTSPAPAIVWPARGM